MEFLAGDMKAGQAFFKEKQQMPENWTWEKCLFGSRVFREYRVFFWNAVEEMNENQLVRPISGKKRKSAQILTEYFW